MARKYPISLNCKKSLPHFHLSSKWCLMNTQLYYPTHASDMGWKGNILVSLTHVRKLCKAMKAGILYFENVWNTMNTCITTYNDITLETDASY